MIMPEAMNQHASAHQDAAPKQEAGFLSEAVNQNESALQYAAPKQVADEMFMLEAVNQNEGVLQYAAPKRVTVKFMSEAVNQNDTTVTSEQLNAGRSDALHQMRIDDHTIQIHMYTQVDHPL